MHTYTHFVLIILANKFVRGRALSADIFLSYPNWYSYDCAYASAENIIFLSPILLRLVHLKKRVRHARVTPASAAVGKNHAKNKHKSMNIICCCLSSCSHCGVSFSLCMCVLALLLRTSTYWDCVTFKVDLAAPSIFS